MCDTNFPTRYETKADRRQAYEDEHGWGSSDFQPLPVKVWCACASCDHSWKGFEGDPCPVCRVADAQESESNLVGNSIKIIALAVILAIVVLS